MAEAGRFPEAFLWGAATSAHQVEGNNTNTDWWRSEQRGLVPYRSGDACRSWERWPEDVRLLAEMGLNAYRLSVEWARIEPEPGRFDKAALDNYRRELEALRAAGIEPLVTLHHFTSPAWLADEGGLPGPSFVPRFATFAERVGRDLGDLVRWWVTINEPSILGMKAYLEGSWPPHRPRDLRGYFRLLRNAARGHAAARQALRSRRTDALASMAFAIWPLEPARAWNPLDRLGAALGDWLWQGRVLRRTLPTLDWVGVNYYTRIRVAIPPMRSVEPAVSDPHGGSGEQTDFGWEVYPAGLYRVLRRVGRLGRPVVVTENGISDADDDQRPRYLVAHLEQAHRAIRAGVDLRGYTHWSLLDNFEWAEGTTQRFGLAETDFATGERKPRPSAALYGAIVRANGITPAVRAEYAPLLARSAATTG